MKSGPQNWCGVPLDFSETNFLSSGKQDASHPDLIKLSPVIDCHGNPTEANALTSQVAAPFQYYVNNDDLRSVAWNGLLYILQVPISLKQNDLKFFDSQLGLKP